MRFSTADYFSRLEALGARSRKEDLYLWPDTPLAADLQQEIIARVGVSDRDVHTRRSRPALIIEQIRSLIDHDLIPPDFSVCDIACGDAIVLWQIKKAFPEAWCAGVDCNRGAFDTHGAVERDGVQLFGAYIQHLFTSDPPGPFDVALMLNTYRGWESAELRERELDLPRLADAWLGRNARYAILTAGRRQVERLTQAGFAVTRLGLGEDESTLVCISRSALPVSAWQQVRGRLFVARAAMRNVYRKMIVRYHRLTVRRP